MQNRKALVMEPNDCAFLGLNHLLKENVGISSEHAADYKTAIRQIKQSHKKANPYDLLITEITGAEGGKDTRELIKEVQGIQPGLRTILYTSEMRPLVLKSMLRDPGVNGYILKNGNGSEELIKAIRSIGKNGLYISPQVDELINQVHHISLDYYDFRILNALANGHSQREISRQFALQKINPASLSSIEKRINQLKDRFHARNNVHLIARANLLGAL